MALGWAVHSPLGTAWIGSGGCELAWRGTYLEEGHVPSRHTSDNSPGRQTGGRRGRLAAAAPNYGEPALVVARPEGEEPLAFSGVASRAIAGLTLDGRRFSPADVFLTDSRNDLWVYDLGTQTWDEPVVSGTRPSALSLGLVTADSAGVRAGEGASSTTF